MRPASGGTISLFAGNCFGTAGDNVPVVKAKFGEVGGVAADRAGNVYISDVSANRSAKLPLTEVIHTFPGNGTAGFFGAAAVRPSPKIRTCEYTKA